MACKNGCTCHNSTSYQPCTAEPICYNGCTSSPCSYKILSKCANDTAAELHHITTLWRHYLYDCTGSGGFGSSGAWSSRVNCAGTGAFPPGVPENPECASETDVVPHNPKCGGQSIGDMIFGCDTPPIVNGTSCTGCTWSGNDLAVTCPVWVLSVGGPPTGGYPPPGPTTGTTASITVYIPDCSNPPGTICAVASYAVAPTATDPNPGFNCLGATSFRKTSSGCFPNYQEIYDRLPDTICVVAGDSNATHPCGIDSADVCSCKDPGCPSFLLDMTIECWQTYSRTVTFTRITTGCAVTIYGVNVCGSISWPTANCGVFVGSIDVSCDDERTLLFLVWCDGTDWKIRTYCVLTASGSLTSATSLGDSTLTRNPICQNEEYTGYWFDSYSADLTSSACCDPCACPDCGTLPGTLNYDITGPGNGSGTVSTGGGTFCFTKLLSNGDNMSIEYNPTTCGVRVNCNSGGGCTTFNCLVFPTVTTNSCDPYDVTIVFTGGGLFCGACGAGTYTVHIYE